MPQSVKISELAKRHGVALSDLFRASGIDFSFSPESLLSAELGMKYAGYFAREKAQADRMKSMGEFLIPSDLVYTDFNSLSYEARQKLTSVQPRTLAQASRIPGVSPSDIQNLVIEIEKRRTRAFAH
jgi:tRNA uridine 5-carboxymethylaminomethyl modification enzyme